MVPKNQFTWQEPKNLPGPPLEGSRRLSPRVSGMEDVATQLLHGSPSGCPKPAAAVVTFPRSSGGRESRNVGGQPQGRDLRVPCPSRMTRSCTRAVLEAPPATSARSRQLSPASELLFHLGPCSLLLPRALCVFSGCGGTRKGKPRWAFGVTRARVAGVRSLPSFGEVPALLRGGVEVLPVGSGLRAGFIRVFLGNGSACPPEIPSFSLVF